MIPVVRSRIAVNVQFLCKARFGTVKSPTLASLAMSEPVVTVKQGKLRGAVLKSVLGSSYVAFKGIPFAAPPVGDLRFKDPQPPAPWTGTKDTTEVLGYSCLQLDELPPYSPIGNEDCLYLNVYTNSLTQSPKAIMFWIHGGAFLVGSSSFELFKPDYLLAKDVVVVTTNYRLGAFGFFNLGHKVAPGNQALKDLIAALEWVKENIAKFGGDPGNVTIFGASAGGALSHALIASPRAKGLFHKAILQSGTLNCTWGMNQCRPERCFKLASLLGKESTDPIEVVEFLRTVSAEDIVKAQANILTPQETASYNLAFGVNSDPVAENPVLPEPIEQVVAEGADVPVMIGSTSHEFIMFFKDKSPKAMAMHNQFLPRHVENLAMLKNLDQSQSEKLLAAAKDRYFDNKPIGEENILGLVEFITDLYFGIPAAVLIEDRVKKARAPNYLYKYSYVGNEKTATDILVDRLVSGASHVDEVAYLFYLPRCKTENPDPPALGTKDRITMERMTRLWTNFAKTGNPTSCQDEFVNVTWKPVTKDELNYLDIGDELKLQPLPQHLLSSKP
ncbi:esterase FE4-like [Ceratina calcarata]|uniref:Carboxylic ester hydrolase n=1 Tax=Ceratina calcarata TaxID=156304 RepID=A0AAJ7JEC6_9HYME|nr:esterase FE4-like [Ceratina calcarata]